MQASICRRKEGIEGRHAGIVTQIMILISNEDVGRRRDQTGEVIDTREDGVDGKEVYT